MAATIQETILSVPYDVGDFLRIDHPNDVENSGLSEIQQLVLISDGYDKNSWSHPTFCLESVSTDTPPTCVLPVHPAVDCDDFGIQLRPRI